MKATDYIKNLGRPVAYYPSLAKIFGIEGSIFVCQLLYWSGKTRDKDGWIYKTVAEIEEETGLTKRQQVWLKKKLLKMVTDAGPVLEIKTNRRTHKTYYKINAEACDKLLLGQVTKCTEAGDNLSPGREQNVTSAKEQNVTSLIHRLPEITTENTQRTESTAEADAPVQKEKDPRELPEFLGKSPLVRVITVYSLLWWDTFGVPYKANYGQLGGIFKRAGLFEQWTEQQLAAFVIAHFDDPTLEEKSFPITWLPSRVNDYAVTLNNVLKVDINDPEAVSKHVRDIMLPIIARAKKENILT